MAKFEVEQKVWFLSWHKFLHQGTIIQVHENFSDTHYRIDNIKGYVNEWIVESDVFCNEAEALKKVIPYYLSFSGVKHSNFIFAIERASNEDIQSAIQESKERGIKTRTLALERALRKRKLQGD